MNGTIRRAALGVLGIGALGIGPAALAGCDLSAERWAVQLPALPAAWRHLDVTLRVTAVDGGDGSEHRLPDARPGSRLALPVGRQAGTVVHVQPLVGGTVPLRPAGAVVTAPGPAQGVLQASWEQGFLADLVLNLWRGGTNPRFLNLARLDREIGARVPRDPWSLDRTAILAALQTNAMRVTLIRPRPAHEVTLRLPAGRWVWWDPFAPPLESDGTTPLTVSARTGYHLLLAGDGTGRALQVDATGGVVVSPAPSN